MSITKIAYFVYFVKDMARAKAFYTDVLNLPLQRDTGAWVQFNVEGGTFALHQADESAADATNAHQAGGIIGFTVENLDTYVDYLKSHQVKLEGEIRDEHFGRLLNISDPDGNIINLFEPAFAGHPHK